MQKTAYCGGAADGWHRHFTKTLLVMKLTMILLIAGFLNVHATGKSQSINYSGKQVSLLQVFKAVEHQTGLVFFYERGLLDKTKPITIAASNMPLVQFLEDVLKEQPLKFNIQSKTITISKKAQRKAAAHSMAMSGEEDVLIELSDPIFVRGRVVNEKGEAIPGVTVSIKGTTIRTVTNDNGDFGIMVQHPKTMLEFTNVSYETHIVEVPQSNNIVVVLKQRVARLDEVTVINTGYQTLTRERATGAFGKPDMSIVRQRTGSMDLIKRLEGQVPGLQISIGSGSLTFDQNQNGIRSQRAVIRGITSVITTGEPLYVLNGIVVQDLSTLNPDDVEDVTVLKDATASAIYGARSANGVLVIKTKSGSVNQRLSVNYTGFVNFAGRPDFGYRKYMNSQQYIQAAKETFDPVVNPWFFTNFTVTAPHDQILYDESRNLISAETAKRKLDSLAALNNLGQIKELFYRPALTTNHTVSVSGGTQAYSIAASLGYTGTQGNTVKSKSDAYKLYLSQNMHIGDRIDLQLNTSVVNTISNQMVAPIPDESFIPYQLFKNSNGESISMSYLQSNAEDGRKDLETRSRIGLHYKPLDEIDMGYSKMENLNINVTGSASVKIWKGLKYAGNFGYIRTSGNSTDYQDNGLLSQRQQIISFTMAPGPGIAPIYNLPETGGTLTTGNSEVRSWMIRNQLIFETELAGGRDRLLVQAGQESQQQSVVRNSNVLFGYDEAMGTYAVLNLANLRRGMPGTVSGFGILTTPLGDLKKDLSRYASSFGLASYSFDQKYSLDLSWRADRSSLLGSDISRQNKPFWSVGGKWRISQQAFMASVNWVNELGIRATYGFTGNSPYAGTAASMDVFSAISTSSFPNAVAGDALSLRTMGNRSLAWENTSNINLGIDFSLLNGRISGSTDYYIRNTTELIGGVPVNPFIASEGITGNIGEIRNRGVELSLRTVNISIKDFNWSTTLNIGFNKNKLLSYSVPAAWQSVPQSQVSSSSEVVGYSLRPLFSYRYAGLNAVGDPQIYLTDKSITAARNVATLKDIVYSGTIQPKISGGLSNSFNFKGIGLTMNMIYNLGAVMRDDVNRFYTGKMVGSAGLNRQNYAASFVDRWKKSGDEAITSIPAYLSNNNLSYTRRDVAYYTESDKTTISADYLKLRDITLSYTIQPATLQFLKMMRVTIFAQANNYMIWRANKSDIDPEFYNPLSGTRTLPPYKHTYSAGLNITF